MNDVLKIHEKAAPRRQLTSRVLLVTLPSLLGMASGCVGTDTHGDEATRRGDSAESGGATYYVSAMTGDDGVACSDAQSPGTPRRTINGGAACLGGGDTLVVQAGVYDEILGDIVPSGTPERPTTVRSEVQHGAIIQPSSDQRPNLFHGWGIVAFLDKSYINFDGFVVDGINLSYVGFVCPYNSAGNSSHHIVISNNDLKNTQDGDEASVGISFPADSYAMTARGNKIHDLGPNVGPESNFGSYGMYISGQDAIIEDNEIYNCSGHGIHHYNAAFEGYRDDVTNLSSNNNIFRNNVIHDNGTRGILFAGGGSNNLAYGNVVYHNGLRAGGAGIVVGGYGNPSGNNKVYNNTVYDNVNEGIRVGSGYQGPVGTIVQNNILWRNGQDDVGLANDTNSIVDHNLVGVDPLFVDMEAGDVRLGAGSPAIDMGVVLDGFPYDGLAPDLGAFESGAGGSSGSTGSGGAGGSGTGVGGADPTGGSGAGGSCGEE